jgi:two-component system chemotaxis response regulator CheB
MGIILSGGLDDGTRGLAAVKQAGGVAVVQQVEDAVVTSMPASAIRHVDVDHVVPSAALAPLLLRLVGAPHVDKEPRVTPNAKRPPEPAERGLNALVDGSYAGPPSAFTCPECHGALWEMSAGDLTRFACHVGHSYSPDSLASGMAATLETALWTALRALEEQVAFLRRMEERARVRKLGTIAAGYAEKARDTEARADVVRGALVDDVAAKQRTPAPRPRPTTPERPSH